MADSDLPLNAAKPAVPPVGDTAGDAFGALVELMRILRSPGGCPWDREQTLDTLKPFVLEEAHEVIDAIERRDFDDLQGEIGDLIFEGVFLAQLCADEQRFTVTEALRDVHAKLVRRHPHVFGDASGERPEGVDTPNAVKGQWEQVKADERAAKGQPRRGMFDGIPKTLPALLAAYEIGNRAAATGFDWPAAHEVLDKIEEEVGELRETLEKQERERQEEELGDLLFAVTNLARKLGIEPEAALRAANRKFTSRFDAMQARLESRGRALGEATLDEMEHAWQAVKRGER
jgi:nucleoside triphosphate diphosphatase